MKASSGMRLSAHSLVNASWFSWFHSLCCLRSSMPVGKVTNHQILLPPYRAQAEREFANQLGEHRSEPAGSKATDGHAAISSDGMMLKWPLAARMAPCGRALRAGTTRHEPIRGATGVVGRHVRFPVIRTLSRHGPRTEFMPSMRQFNRGRKGEPKTNSINTRQMKNRDRRRRSRPPMASAE
jgi:hypothetical protein